MECMKWLYGILGVIPGYLWPRRERDTAEKRWLRILVVARWGKRLRRATVLSRLRRDGSRDVESLLPSLQSSSIAPASVELVQPLFRSPDIAPDQPIPSSESSDAPFFTPVHSSPDRDPNEPNPGSHASFFKKSLPWFFPIASLLLEALSEVFNQLSSKSRPDLGLAGAVMSFVTLLFCIIELIYRGKKENVAWRKWGMIYWFLHSDDTPFGTLSDVTVLICSILQCVFASIAYAFFCKHHDDPIKLSAWPIFFALGLLLSKIYQQKCNPGTETEPGRGRGPENPRIDIQGSSRI